MSKPNSRPRNPLNAILSAGTRQKVEAADLEGVAYDNVLWVKQTGGIKTASATSAKSLTPNM